MMKCIIFCIVYILFYVCNAIENKNLTSVIHDRSKSARDYSAPHYSQSSYVEHTSGSHAGYPFSNNIQSEKFTHDNTLHSYFYQNRLSLYCAADTTYEKITWKRYACPNEIDTHPGEIIAVGADVSNTQLYGVNSFGRNEEYVSELLIKQPLIAITDGAYICEGVFLVEKDPHKTSTVIKDIIIVGGKGMYLNCFTGHVHGRRSMREINNQTNFVKY